MELSLLYCLHAPWPYALDNRSFQQLCKSNLQPFYVVIRFIHSVYSLSNQIFNVWYVIDVSHDDYQQSWGLHS